MSDRFWEGEWPNLASISIALPTAFRFGIAPAITGVLYRLCAYIAVKSVHGYYSEAELDPSLPTSKKELLLIAGCKPKELEAARPYFEVLFEERDGRLRLIDDAVIRYTRPTSREAISRDVKAAAAARQGMRCVYCGGIQGPFHYDHLYPVSRGGTNAPSNIVIACVQCNLSKRDMTLAEWMEAARQVQ